MTAPSKASRLPHSRLLPIAASHAFGLLCGVAGVKLTSTLLPPADMGRLGVFLSFAPLGMWVVHIGLIKFITRHWAGATDQAALRRTRTAAFFRLLPWLAGATAAAALSFGLANWPANFALLFTTAALLSWSALAQAELQAAQLHWRDFAVSATASLSRSFLPAGLYWFTDGASWSLFAGLALHGLAAAVAGQLALRPARSTSDSNTAPALENAYAGPLFVVLSLNGWVMSGLQRWVTAAFFGAEKAGYVTLASNLATLVPAILGTIFLQYFQPGFFAATLTSDADRHALARRIDRAAFTHGACAIGALLALRFIAPFLVGPIIGESYRAALGYLLPTGCAMLALVTGWFYHSLLLAGRREAACSYVELTAAAVILLGSVAAAAVNRTCWETWCMVTPLLPWLINRPLARRYFFMMAAAPAPAPAR